MLRGAIVAALVLFVGHELAERLRVRREEIILRKLPEVEAMTYYAHLRRRARRTRVLRGLVLVSLVAGLLALKRILAQRSGLDPGGVIP